MEKRHEANDGCGRDPAQTQTPGMRGPSGKCSRHIVLFTLVIFFYMQMIQHDWSHKDKPDVEKVLCSQLVTLGSSVIRKHKKKHYLILTYIYYSFYT